MVALYVQPIFAANEPTRVVGLTAGTLSWATVLTGVVPAYVGDIDCVVQTHSGHFTFTISEGVPTLRGQGDLHDPEFSSLRICNDDMDNVGYHDLEADAYKLSFYPTQNFHNRYFNWSPVQSALVMVSIFALCSFLFYVYDHLMKQELDALLLKINRAPANDLSKLCVALMQVHAKQKGISLVLKNETGDHDSRSNYNNNNHDNKATVTPFASVEEAPHLA
eukprot:gene34910-39476_t